MRFAAEDSDDNANDIGNDKQQKQLNPASLLNNPNPKSICGD